VTLPAAIELRCDCGQFAGSMRIEPHDRPRRLRCYCDDCQAFQHYLGRAADILDAQGGSDIVQLSPSAVGVDRGRDQLRCVRLSARGILRWYAGCCRTPIANSLPTRQLPFVSLFEHALRDQRSLDRQLGTARPAVFGRFAKGDGAAIQAHRRLPLAMIASALAAIARRRLAGAHNENPFFDVATGRPRAVPLVLGSAERDALRRI